jgi:hypothetical protein
MKKNDMSPHAVTMRIKQTSDLRRLCIALGSNRLKVNIKKPFLTRRRKDR